MSETVLNVDDNEASRYVKTRVLRAAGFEVLEAATGHAALEAAASAHPALVLLDIKLPDINGIEVCRRLRADARTARIPVIHITATRASPRDEATSLGAGADLYLAEPVGSQELSSAVRTLLRLRATEQGLAASEERLRLATEAAGVATWEVSLATGAAAWSESFARMLGADPGLAQSLEAWLGRVHEDDRERLRGAFGRARDDARGFSQEFRTASASGATRWVAASGRVLPAAGAADDRLVGVAIDITERKAAELEREEHLARAREAQRAAEDLARTKDEFLAILSHELRTPMSAVLGWLHLLRGGRLSAEQQAEALETVERNARLQTQLINDLLDVSRIVTGKMELDAELVSLRQSLEAAVESSRPAAEARGQRIALEMAPTVDWTIVGNAGRLQQVFGNLLSNAVKFSAPGGRIHVRAAANAEQALVQVADEGEGISPEVLPHVFDRFRQADSSSRRRHAGLGLGLAIVRSLVELHGGEVEAASPGRGRGAVFSVRLPLASPHAGAAGSREREDGELRLDGIRVLAVDDDADNLRLLATTLRLQNASVITACDAVSALAMYRQHPPDILILDIGLPEVDGYELLARLHLAAGEPASGVPAIALSGFAGKSDVERARRAGFQAHIAKPFDAGELCGVVRRLAAAEPVRIPG